jgi:hypothetical protein
VIVHDDYEMDSVTKGNHKGKWVRIAHTEPSKMRPTSQAIEMVKLAASVTLALLQPAIKTLGMWYHITFLKLWVDLCNLDNTQSRLVKEHFIPQSAHFDFALNVTNRVKEHAITEYKTLLEQTNLELTLFQRTAKRLIVQ